MVKKLAWSIGCWSVGWSIGRLVSWLVGLVDVVEKLQSAKLLVRQRNKLYIFSFTYISIRFYSHFPSRRSPIRRI